MGECKYCQIVKNKTNAVYEDDNLVAIVPEKPATKGHIQVIAKKHLANMQEAGEKELEHIFYAASFAASSLFETLEAHGTNIIANTGGMLKKDGHFHLDIIARKNNDSLNFMWTPKKLPEEEMKSVQGKIKDKADMIGIAKKKEVFDLDRKEREKVEQHPEENKEKKEEKEQAKEKSAEEAAKPKKTPEEKDKLSEKTYEENKEKKDSAGEDNESYLIKQLRRIP
jgi:histidine triad (HIT) family protein